MKALRSFAASAALASLSTSVAEASGALSSSVFIATLSVSRRDMGHGFRKLGIVSCARLLGQDSREDARLDGMVQRKAHAYIGRARGGSMNATFTGAWPSNDLALSHDNGAWKHTARRVRRLGRSVDPKWKVVWARF